MENIKCFIYIFVLVFNLVKTVSSVAVYNEEIDGSIQLHHTPMTWKDARFKCYEEGGILASPETEEMSSAMLDVMGASSPAVERVYTGIQDTYSKDHFQSLEGTPLKQMPATLLSTDSDNADSVESCLVMHQDGNLIKNKCTDDLQFICYKREPNCGPDKGYTYEKRTGSCYKLHEQKLTWSRAFAACAAEEGHLAIINSHTEAEVIKEFGPIAKNITGNEVYGISLGFRDWHNHTLWMTIDGKTLKEAGYDEWTKNEPNNLGHNEFCGGLVIKFALNDIDCDSNHFHFVCEKKPVGSTRRERIYQHMERCPATREPLCIVC